MAADIISLRLCTICRAPAAAVHVERDGEIVASAALCEPCLTDAHAGAEVNRRLFDVLMAEGVDRETANAMLIAKVDLDAAREVARGS